MGPRRSGLDGRFSFVFGLMIYTNGQGVKWDSVEGTKQGVMERVGSYGSWNFGYRRIYGRGSSSEGGELLLSPVEEMYSWTKGLYSDTCRPWRGRTAGVSSHCIYMISLASRRILLLLEG